MRMILLMCFVVGGCVMNDMQASKITEPEYAPPSPPIPKYAPPSPPIQKMAYPLDAERER